MERPATVLTVICLILGLVVSERSGVAVAEPPPQENVRFHWAFGAIVKGKNNQEFMAIKRKATLKVGDRFKMLVELQKKCFVYVIYHSAQNNINLLFPYDLQQFSGDYETLTRYYIPQGDAWFELDERVGHETFYLLASSQRLLELEALWHDYISADRLHKPELVPRILTVIRQMKRRNQRLSTSAERPATIAGTVRAIHEKGDGAPLFDVAAFAVEIAATNFYSRTFTIDHQ